MFMALIKVFISLIIAFTACNNMLAQATTKAEVLERAHAVNAYFMRIWPDPTLPTFVRRERPTSLWTRAVYYEGLMALQDVDGRKAYEDYINKWCTHHGWTPRNGTTTVHADDQCCSQTYLEMYLKERKEYQLEATHQNTENQMATGRNDYWTWIDAIQMAMPVYSHMYRITGDDRYLDFALRSYVWARDSCGGGLLNEKTGLWWRDKDFVPPYKEPDGNDCYWSRGNAWVYAALVRVIADLKAVAPSAAGKHGKGIGKASTHAKLLRLLTADYLLMSKAILACQRDDGFWNVSLHSPTTFGGKETSGTSLFLYGLAWGLNNGLLKAAKYRKSADAAWHGLADSAACNADGSLGYVQGTGKQPSDGQPVTATSIPDFIDYGIGCFLLGATEYSRLLK